MPKTQARTRSRTPSRRASRSHPPSGGRAHPLEHAFAAPTPAFRVLTLDHKVYARFVLDPEGHFVEPLSFGLSDMIRGRARGTARDYITALRCCLDVWWAAGPAPIDALFTDLTGARSAIRAMLRANGCTLRRSRRPDGSLLVQLLDASGAPATHGHQRIIFALLALQHVFTALETHDRWPHPNPLLVDEHGQIAQLLASLPAPPGTGPKQAHQLAHFLVIGRPRQYAKLDCTLYAPQILAAAEAWPPGIAAATRLLIACGCRISEIWALTLADWAEHDFSLQLSCPDKGSSGERIKTLFLRERDRADLAAWVDGPRAAATGLTLAAARRRAERLGAASLADEPLFLGPRGAAIKPGTYRDCYFRPAMAALGLADIVTPHRPRHETAFEALETIRRIANSPAEEARLQEDFAQLMGWRSGAAMVHYYAPQSKMRSAQSLAERIFAAEAEPADSPPASPLPAARAHDPLLAAFRQGAPS